MKKARAHLTAVDPALGRHIAAVGPYRLKARLAPTLYHALAQAIVYQQLSGKAAATIFSRLEALGTDGLPEPAELLALDDERLRAAGISRPKLRALRDLAEKANAGLIPTVDEAQQLDDETLVSRLVAVRGIGRWTVEMLLIFGLGRQDVLPATDYGVQKGFQRVFRTRTLPQPKHILARGERWRPYRTMASWYLWRAVDTVTPN